MKHLFFSSLIWKISAIVFLIESVILASLGIYYTNRFSLEIDKRIEMQVQLPGILMNRQLLMYESVSDRDIMTELVGEEFVDGIVFGANKAVFYTLNADYAGKTITDIPGLDPGWIDKEKTETRIIKISGRHDTFLVSITPLVAYEEAKPFFFVYIKVNTNRSEARKTAIAGFFIVGSVFCVVLTSLLIIAFMQTLITRPLSSLERDANQLAQGNLEREIETTRQDELGSLARSFGQMRNAIRQKIGQLEELNQTLEQKVKTRTQELQKSVELLQQEITERKRAEAELQESEEKFRTLFDHAPVLIDEFDSNGRCILWNKECEKTFGWAIEEINASDDPLALFYPVPEVRNEVIESVTSGPDRTFREWYPITKDGTELVTLWANFQLPGGLVINIGYDITVRKRMEEELLLAKEVAEAANNAKSVFLANMSHELRTPLNSILGYAQILSRSQNLPPEEKEHLSTIMRSGEHLLTLINAVLELSKIDANRIELQPVNFDLHQMLSDLEAMFHLRTERKGLTLTFEYASDVPSHIRADQNKLRQILINLLGNAVKYTEEGGVTVRIENCRLNIENLGKEGSNHQSSIVNLQFSISDTGIGIAPADLENIFDAFVRVDDQQYNRGTGLGLPISQKYVRMMGGDIHVESEVGKRSTFSFDIRAEIADQSTIDTQQQSTIPKQVVGLEPGQPNYRLLIVEDEEDNRNLLVQVLKPLGFQVREALNGKEAIELWKTWQPHLIWMDMRMSVMDGYAATQEIRRAEGRRAEEQKLRSWEVEKGTLQSTTDNRQSTIIIALTASAFEEDRKKVLTAGCDDFVRKPFQEAEIFEMLHKHLGVQFVYEEETQSTIDNRQSTIEDVLTPEALNAVPAEWLATLEHGAREASPSMLFEVIEQIRRHDVTVAEALARLTNDFEYDEILALLQGDIV